jgi:chaperonin GroEL
VAAPGVILDRIRTQGPTATYDAMNEKVVDAFESGILDATEVLITALQVAASGALMALTTDTIVYHKDPKQSLQP